MTFEIVYAKELEEVLKQKSAELIDIRSYKEYKQEHWPGATSLPLHDTDNYETMLDNNRYYIIYCQHGGNSMQLARYLGRRGYHTASVVGGYETMKKFRKNYLKMQAFMTQ